MAAEVVRLPPLLKPSKEVEPLADTEREGFIQHWFAAIAKKLHLHARRIVFPHPRGGTVDITAPLPLHMRETWSLFGFDPDRYDDGEAKD